MFAATVGGLSWIGVQIYHAISDSWIVPLHLSPDNDGVAQLRLNHQRQMSELARLDAEVARIDGELAAIGEAVTKLDGLRHSSDATLTWQAEQSKVEQKGLATTRALLVEQRDTVQTLRTRQQELLERARVDLHAGLVDRTTVDREQIAVDQLSLELGEIDRQLADVDLRRTHNDAILTGLHDTGSFSARSRMPEVAAGDEHTARVEVEITRLEAEARGHRALRAAAVASAANQRTLLAELESRPLYRAMTTATDVAFVPYDQLANVHAGSTVVNCTWGLFHCVDVGTVTEVMPGEVITQDPWGKPARGQYIVLALDDTTAVRERVLRVRD
jgi:hypothetical protein